MLITTAISGRNAGNSWRSIGRGDIQLNLNNVSAPRIRPVAGDLHFREIEGIGAFIILQREAKRHRFAGERFFVNLPGSL